MFSSLETMIAFRYLRARRKSGFVSVVAGFSLVGIALGVATLIIVLAVMSGVRAELTTRIVGISPHIMVYAPTARMAEYETLTQKMTGMAGIASAAPVVEGQVMVTAGSASSGALVNGIAPADLKRKILLIKSITAGDLTTFEAGEGVVIGYRMAERLGLRAGDPITLISPEGRATLAGVVPRIKTYTVSAIFNSGMYEYDFGLIVMPLTEAQSFFKHKDPMLMPATDGGLPSIAPRTTVSGLEIMVHDAADATQIAHDIAQNLPRGFRVIPWQEQRASLFAALAIQRNMMAVVLMLIILVASFTLVSGLVMLVQGKGRDIAILRTMGATRARIMRIFILAGSAIGFVGTFSGLALGLLIAANIAAIQHFIERILNTELFADSLYFFTTLPSQINALDVIWVTTAAVLLSFIATLYPAWRAASLHPAEALRYE